MMQIFTIVCALFLVAQDKPQAQDKGAQIVGTAEITKIDAKKKVLQVRSVVEANNTSSPNPNNRPRRSGGGGGGYPGGGRRRPGDGYPGGGYPGGRGRYPGGDGGGGRSPGGGAPASQVKEYKVFITKDTVLKLEDQDAEFSDMHVGDRIVVAGTPKGSGGDLDATTITRKF